MDGRETMTVHEIILWKFHEIHDALRTPASKRKSILAGHAVEGDRLNTIPAKYYPGQLLTAQQQPIGGMIVSDSLPLNYTID